ncbi:MAG: hypothetical protein II816_06575, partial [Elusimicrobia bacterium]|nr:hypothetical protein [Elusimicrobiota bacterium]
SIRPDRLQKLLQDKKKLNKIIDAISEEEPLRQAIDAVFDFVENVEKFSIISQATENFVSKLVENLFLPQVSIWYNKHSGGIIHVVIEKNSDRYSLVFNTSDGSLYVSSINEDHYSQRKSPYTSIESIEKNLNLTINVSDNHLSIKSDDTSIKIYNVRQMKTSDIVKDINGTLLDTDGDKGTLQHLTDYLGTKSDIIFLDDIDNEIVRRAFEEQELLAVYPFSKFYDISKLSPERILSLYIQLNMNLAEILEKYFPSFQGNKFAREAGRITLFEFVKNAIIHGNLADLSKPIYIKYNSDGFAVYNVYHEGKTTSKELLSISAAAGLSGVHKGISNAEENEYISSVTTEDKRVRNIGGQLFYEVGVTATGLQTEKSLEDQINDIAQLLYEKYGEKLNKLYNELNGYLFSFVSDKNIRNFIWSEILNAFEQGTIKKKTNFNKWFSKVLKRIAKEQKQHKLFYQKNIRGKAQIAPNTWWAEHHVVDKKHYAWKIHLYVDSEEEYEKMTKLIMPVLADSQFSWKTANDQVGMSMFNSSNQKGKAFVLYPRNKEEFKEIATVLDKIFKENNFTRQDSSIQGDRKLGTTGRIFYRYEYSSAKYKDKIFDLDNKSEESEYKYSAYERNRSEDNYMASDMTEADDPFIDFDPAVMNNLQTMMGSTSVSNDIQQIQVVQDIKKTAIRLFNIIQEFSTKFATGMNKETAAVDGKKESLVVAKDKEEAKSLREQGFNAVYVDATQQKGVFDGTIIDNKDDGFYDETGSHIRVKFNGSEITFSLKKGVTVSEEKLIQILNNAISDEGAKIQGFENIKRVFSSNDIDALNDIKNEITYAINLPGKELKNDLTKEKSLSGRLEKVCSGKEKSIGTKTSVIPLEYAQAQIDIDKNEIKQLRNQGYSFIVSYSKGEKIDEILFDGAKVDATDIKDFKTAEKLLKEVQRIKNATINGTNVRVSVKFDEKVYELLKDINIFSEYGILPIVDDKTIDSVKGKKEFEGEINETNFKNIMADENIVSMIIDEQSEEFISKNKDSIKKADTEIQKYKKGIHAAQAKETNKKDKDGHSILDYSITDLSALTNNQLLRDILSMDVAGEIDKGKIQSLLDSNILSSDAKSY